MYRRFVACVASAAIVIGIMPAPLVAQPAPGSSVATPDETQQSQKFRAAQPEARPDQDRGVALPADELIVKTKNEACR